LAYGITRSRSFQHRAARLPVHVSTAGHESDVRSREWSTPLLLTMAQNQPLPQLPPLVLEPFPEPDPNAPQPNWNNLANALTTISNELTNLPNAVSPCQSITLTCAQSTSQNPMEQIMTMNANMIAMVQSFNRLQTTVVTSVNQLQTTVNQLQTTVVNGLNGINTK
jgi:hypothetical protein